MSHIANATLEQISPKYDPQHPVDNDRVQAIIEHLTIGQDEDGDPIYRDWDLSTVVVVEDEGNGYLVLDGHHRLEAAKRLYVDTIPAWVITVDDYCRLIEKMNLNGDAYRLYDLREHIMCGDVDANSVCDIKIK